MDIMSKVYDVVSHTHTHTHINLNYEAANVFMTLHKQPSTL